MIFRRSAENNKTRFKLRFGKLAFMLGLMLMISAGAYAQEPNAVDGDPDVPFDGGISLLVAAGVAYGAKQWHNSRKQQEDSTGE